jgi:hypothetical protein
MVTTSSVMPTRVRQPSFIRQVIAALLFVFLIVGPVRPASAQSADIPLNLITVNGNAQALAIDIGIAGGTPKPYLFDTGSTVFNAAYSSAWFPPPTSTLANNVLYSYGSASSATFLANLVTVPNLSFCSSSNPSTPGYTLRSISPGYQIDQVMNEVWACPIRPE